MSAMLGSGPLKKTIGALQEVCLSGHRRLGFREWGDLAGYPVFYAHGTPGSSAEGAYFDEAARRQGLRWIAIDRPGIGRSHLMPGYRILDYPRDVQWLAHHLGIKRFALVGWSGGVPYTLACGHRISGQLDYVGILAGYTNFAQLPAATELLRAIDQHGPVIAETSPLLFRTILNMLRVLERHWPRGYLQFVESSCTSRDKSLLERRQPEFFATQNQAFRQGIEGIARDLLLQYADWGFGLETVKGRMHLYQGMEDRFVPWEFASHMAKCLPQASLALLPGEGHMFALDNEFQRELMAGITKEISAINDNVEASAEASVARMPA